jgi:hypothetical protein
MKGAVIAAAVGIALACASTAVAQEGARIYGAGARDCAGFLADVKASPNLGLSYFSWAQGYMSHRNTIEKEKNGHDVNLTPKAFDYSKQYEAMGNFCVINGTAHFVDAVEAVYERLRAMDAVSS